MALTRISTLGLVAPYYCFKYSGKNQNAKISSEDIELYRKIYSEEYKKRKLKNILGGSGLLGLAAGMGIFILVSKTISLISSKSLSFLIISIY